MAAGSLAGHKMTQNGQEGEAIRIWKTLSTGEDPRTYRMAFLSMGGPLSCPVEGCPGQAAMRTAMRLHFMHRYVLGTMVIFEEGNTPHPQ